MGFCKEIKIKISIPDKSGPAMAEQACGPELVGKLQGDQGGSCEESIPA
jgi:hypothetical protein